MTIGRRLDHLEEGLPPKEGVLLWLQEAHEHGSLVDYCAWLVERPYAEAPLVRLHEQATRDVRRRLKGVPYERRADAEEQADRDVAFLFELVMELESSADEMCRLGGLRYGMLFWEGRAINAESRRGDRVHPDDPRPSIAERRADWRAGVSAFRVDLRVQDEVRRLLEARYLDGRVALFPETVGRWERLREAVGDLRHLGPPDAAVGPDPEPDAGWIAAETERRLGWVQAQALDILGDREGATAIVGRWFRGSEASGGAP